jgi:WD40 repeat protein
MAIISPDETITTAGTYIINSSLINERVGIKATSIIIRRNGLILTSSQSSPASAEIVLEPGDSGSFDISVTGVDSVGRSYSSSRTYQYDIPITEVGDALFAVTFWDHAETKTAIKVFDATSLSVIPDSPAIAHQGMFCRFSPGGQYLAVAYLEEGEVNAAKLAVYNTQTWELESVPQPSSTAEVAHIDWSADGRLLCAFFGNDYLLLDSQNEWAELTIDDTFPGTGDNATHGCLFVGSAELWVLLNSGPIKRYSLYDLGDDLPLVNTISTLDSHTLTKSWCGAVRPDSETVLDGAEVALLVDTEDEVFRNRLFVINPGGTVIHHEEIAQTNLIVPQIAYSPDGGELAFIHTLGDSQIKVRDATDEYSAKTGITLAENKVFDYSTLLSAVMVGRLDTGELNAIRYAVDDKTVEDDGEEVISTVSFLTSGSVNDRAKRDYSARFLLSFGASPYAELSVWSNNSLISISSPDTGFSGSIYCLSIDSHPTGLTAHACRAEGARLWITKKGQWDLFQDDFLGLLPWVVDVVLHPDNAKYMLITSQLGGARISLYERITIDDVDRFYLRNFDFTASGYPTKFSYDGELIAIGHNSTLKIYTFDTATAQLENIQNIHIGQFINGVAWTKDSRYLAVSNSSDYPRFHIFERDFEDDSLTAKTIDLFWPLATPTETGGHHLAWHPAEDLVIIGGDLSVIYAYRKNEDGTFSNVTESVVEQPGVGGRVTAIEWDATGERLVAGFQGASAKCVTYCYVGGQLIKKSTISGSITTYDIHHVVYTDEALEPVLIDNSAATTNTMELAGGSTLSNGDLTVTMPAGDANGGRSVGKIRGKLYIEFNTDFEGLMIGVCSELANYTWADGGAQSAYYFVGTGANYRLLTGGSAASDSADLVGGWCGMAIDTLNRRLWLRDKNGVFWDGDPVAGTGGWQFIALKGGETRLAVWQGSGTTQTAVTINFGATSFTHAVPTGFNE